eukprot:7723226-Karenia_brevis.AAC.1
MHAAANRMSKLAPTARHVTADEWVKAHRGDDTALNSHDLFKIRGNRAADEAAVLARRRCDFDPRLWQQVQEEKELHIQVCRVIGAMASLWPSAKQHGAIAATPSRCRRQRKQTRLVGAYAHSWAFYNGRWACRACLASAATDTAKARHDRKSCPGYRHPLAAILQNPQGHRLAHTDSTCGPVIICFACGAWTCKTPVKLKERCAGSALASGWRALLKVRSGKHPDARRCGHT